MRTREPLASLGAAGVKHEAAAPETPAVFEPEMLSSCHINTVQGSIDVERAAEPSGTIDQLSVDLHRPDQNSSRKVGPLRHHIQTVVHAINQINIRHAGRTEQHLGPGRPSFRSMAGLVLRANIGLDFDDLSRKSPLPILPDQIFPKQRPRDNERGAIEMRL